MIGNFVGVPVMVSENAVQDTGVIDTSRCRSPSRALRRLRKRPLPTIKKPCAFQFMGKLLVHPIIYAELKRQAAQ